MTKMLWKPSNLRTNVNIQLADRQIKKKMPVGPKSLSFHLFLEANRRLWAEKTEAGCEQVRAERREMLTDHRIFIMAKSQTKARG